MKRKIKTTYSKVIRRGDLVKITGRSSTKFEDKPYLIVLKKDTLNSVFSSIDTYYLYCCDSNRVFHWSAESYPYESIVKVENYYNKNLECIDEKK